MNGGSAGSRAALGRAGDDSLKTMTLLAAQTDSTDPGELALFIDEGQVDFLESLMARRGYLDKQQMRSTFQMLRSNDLIWSYRLHNHLLGERPVNDLMAWNADGTRLPCRMHVEYLRGLFLPNALAHGEWQLDGAPVNLGDIRVLIFNVRAVQDHVAPWRSVSKLQALTDAEQTFVLTGGGHNVGIVNPPGQPKANYRIRTWQAGDRLLTPDEWLDATTVERGSWWTLWSTWLARHSSGRVAPPPMGAAAHGLAPHERCRARPVRARALTGERPASIGTSVNENDRIARTLLRLAAGPGSDRVSVAELLRAFGPHAPAVLTLLFAAPNVLPMPPGTSAILGTPLLFMTVQLALGAPAWVPRAIADRSLSKATIGPAMRRIAAALIARHPLLRPRLQPLVAPPAVRLIGVISSLLALILFLPIPFGNMLPALAIAMLALGILCRDGLCVLVGLCLAGVAVGLLWAFAATFGWAALESLWRWLG